MQMAYVGPIVRIYHKANEPSWYLQSGIGYGYFSVSNTTDFLTSRHTGNAATIGIGYEIDLFWDMGIDYMYNDIASSTSENNLRLSAHSLVFSLNFHPK